MTVRRLFYVSDSLIGSDVSALDTIMVQARTGNAIDGISGLLWTDGKSLRRCWRAPRPRLMR